jgi:GGDEF domain-containing protein/DNA-binding CsgD family transcriptional regulator
MWACIAVLDQTGTIVDTNTAWNTFLKLNGGPPNASRLGVSHDAWAQFSKEMDEEANLTARGVNYIDLCDRSGAQFVAHGLRSVLSRECLHFDVNYACPSPIEDRWFVLEASQLAGGGAMVGHSNITAQILVEDRAQRAVDDDPLTGLPTLSSGLRMLEDTLAEASATGVRIMVATIRMPLLADITLSHGRLARDEVLIQIASRARRLMRSGDFLVRSGPAAFLLVARQVDHRDGDQLLEELGQILTPPLQVGPFEIATDASLEVVTSNAVSTVDALLQHRPSQARVRGLIAARHDRFLLDESGSNDIGGTIVGSPLPMMVFSLPDQRVRAANRAAADLVGLAPAELTRRHAKDLMQTDNGKTPLALASLSSGALDSYRARRTFLTAAGQIDVWIWVRAIPRRSGALALLLVLPTDHDDQFQLPTRALMGPLAVDLASGTMDDAGTIVTLSRSNAGVLRSQREGPIETRQLITHVHPHDQPRLSAALERFRADRHNIVIAVRIRHAHRGWVTSDCHLFATGDDNSGEPIGFVLAEATPDVPTSGRVAQLEQHLSRIASEARASGAVAADSSVSEPKPNADLGPLTPRQREIVERLLDGQRVPTIAAALYVSRSTVRNHLAGVYRTFDVHSQSDLLELLRSA